MLPVHAETTDPTAPTPTPTPEPESILPTDPTDPEPAPIPTPTPTPTGVVQWQLDNVSFFGGGTASGTFTYDYTSTMATDWNITVSEGSFLAGGFTITFSERSYTMENSTFENSSTSLTFVASDEEGRRLILPPVLSLTAPTDNLSIDLLSLATSTTNSERNTTVATAALRRITSGSLVGTFV